MPAYARQPAARLIPFANDEDETPFTERSAVLTPPVKEEVAAPVTERTPVENVVEVALVVVAFTPVKFWRVVEPFARIFCAVSALVVAPVAVMFVATRLPMFALVLVEFVIVAFGANSPPIAERSPEK